MIAYFDTSALVKLVVEEDGSEIARLVWNDADTTLTSRLAYPEALAALAAAKRSSRLTAPRHEEARAAFVHLFSTLRVVEVGLEIARAAGALAESLRLRGSDAVHLASAAAIGAAVLTTWDRDQRRAAAELGLALATS